MTNVADKLRTPTKKWPWFVGVPVVAALAVGLSVGASALNRPTAAPTPTASATSSVVVLTQAELDTVQAQAGEQVAHNAAIAKAAADAAAAKAAADAAATKSSSTTTWAPGQAPAGTPIPLHLDNDPNSGSYGQMVIENPDQFCASNGGTTAPDGQAVCS